MEVSLSVAVIVKDDRFNLNKCPEIILRGNRRKAFLMLQVLEALCMSGSTKDDVVFVAGCW